MRFRPALLPALLLAACLTPTDGGGRFGEARVQPEFAEGSAPSELGLAVDRVHTLITRGAETLVDAVRDYEEGASQAWILELQSIADDVVVTMELLVGDVVAYEGQRAMTVSEGTAGRSPVEAVPVSYIATDIAARVDVVPADFALAALGATRQLQAVAYDPNDVVITGKAVSWSTLNDDVASVDENGLVTATGVGITSIVATVDGVSDAATVFVDTAIVRNSTITADSASIAANGVASTLVTVRILDANGLPINASAGVVELATSLGALGEVTDHEDGTYTALLTAGTVAGTAHVSGELNNVALADTAEVDFRALTADATTTTITADSAAIDADGLSTTLITVAVRDANDNPVTGGTVLLTTTLGSLTEVTPHEDGTHTALLTAGTVAGLAIISGTLDGVVITDTAGVELRALTPSAITTTITADSAAINADGVSTTLITAEVRDVNGNLVAGGTVGLTTTLGALSTVAPLGDGRHTAVLTAGTVAGLAIISGTLDGAVITDTAGVVLRPLAPSAITTTITADSAAIDADGVSSTLITVAVRDANDNPVAGGAVLLTTTLGSLTEVTPHENGTHTALLTAGRVAGLAVISGTLDGALIADTAGVILRALTPSVITTTITADSAAINADGVSSTLITAEVRDANGNLVPDGAVGLTTTLGTLGEVTPLGDGRHTAVLTAGTVAGLAIISGTLDGAVITDTAGVVLRPLAPSAITTTITADSAAIDADGISSTLITVAVRDANDNPVTGGAVLLTTTLGSLTEVTPHENGTHTALLTAGTIAGLAIISGTLDGVLIADTAGVILRALTPSVITTTITADSAAINADGVATTLITAEVRDVNGNLVPGGAAGLTTTLGTLGEVTPLGDGRHTAVLTAGTVAGLAVISGTLDGAVITDTAGVILRALAPSAIATTITADSAAIDADGVSTTLITVAVRDANNNPVAGGTVLLTTTLGSLTEVTPHEDGTHTALLTAGTLAGTAQVSGTLDSQEIADTARVVLRPGEPSTTRTTITADSTSILADGISYTTITVSVLDEFGNPVGTSAGTVALTSTLGILSDIADHGDGTYTATLRADTTKEKSANGIDAAVLIIPSDSAVVSGTLNGAAIADSAAVEFRPHSSEQVISLSRPEQNQIPTWSPSRSTPSMTSRAPSSKGTVKPMAGRKRPVV